MALKKCVECGGEISSKADSCPKCGAPSRKGFSIGCIGVVILLVVGSFFFIEVSSCVKEIERDSGMRKSAMRNSQNIQIAKESRAREKKKNRIFFSKYKASVIAEVTSLYGEEKYQSAINKAQPYIHTNDKDLLHVYAMAKVELDKEREEELLALLKKIPAAKYAENLRHYKELASLYPDREKYRTKYEHYAEKLKGQRAAQKLKAKRRKQAEAQFSGWDGSHINLTKLIKKSMNDPESYEHAETVFAVREKYIEIVTTFRGRNAFGAMKMRRVKGKATIDGTVIEMTNVNN